MPNSYIEPTLNCHQFRKKPFRSLFLHLHYSLFCLTSRTFLSSINTTFSLLPSTQAAFLMLSHPFTLFWRDLHQDE